MKRLLTFHLYLLHVTIVSFSLNNLAIGSPGDKPELIDKGKKIENKITLNLSKKQYNNIQKITGNKYYVGKTQAIINNDSVEVVDLHTRGKTTLHYRRKSLSFDLDSKVTFVDGNSQESMKKFEAISLSMDKYYFRNRLAFELMDEINLFGLFHAYCELSINGQSEGIYLIIQRPQDWALKQNKSPFLLRRSYGHQIDKIKTGKDVENYAIKKYKNHYRQIYVSLKKYDGEELYDVLSQWIDLEMYMKWLAFNFFLHNGDYTDEVYFYIDPAEERFKIIPWDYDDIFAMSPHEGKAQVKQTIGNKYIFSSEDKLDQKIANDPYLYEMYILRLKELLQTLDDDILKTVLENTYADLYPYYSNAEIIGMVKYDERKTANLQTLMENMQSIYMQLTNSRRSYINIL